MTCIQWIERALQDFGIYRKAQLRGSATSQQLVDAISAVQAAHDAAIDPGDAFVAWLIAASLQESMSPPTPP